mmetsp:Transcript_26676/g.61377  ORF Transcript_26676/g.61377 Transcript_26676/m.61377 type:complete len:95 (+) Transcript_26676:1026-1310(+)
MICIVLNIQANEGFRNSECNGKSPARSIITPNTLQGKKEETVKDGTGKEAGSTKFTAIRNYFENFSLQFTFERSSENVSIKRVSKFWVRNISIN